MSIFLPKERKRSFFNYVPTPLRQWVLVIALFGLKNEKLLELIKLLKLMKASSAVASTFSVLVSVGFYAVDKGSAFALAFIGALLIHEAGHVWAIHYLKLGAFWETFFSLRAFPGVGAFIQAPPMASREEEAFIGYGGPLFSTVGGILLFLSWFVTPAVKMNGLHHFFLVLTALFAVAMLYHVSLLREKPISKKDLVDAKSWGDVLHKFFSVPLVRKICAHAFLGGVAFSIWMFATPSVVSAQDFVFMSAFISMVLAVFNLAITIRPLDGGRILQIVGSLFAYTGIATLIALTLYLHESSVFLIWMIVLVGIRTHPVRRFYAVLLAGFGLAATLLFGQSSQTFFENIVDVFLGMWMLSIAYARTDESWNKGGDRRTIPREEEERQDRRKEGAPWPVRLKWLGLYLLILLASLVLGALLLYFTPPHFRVS